MNTDPNTHKISEQHRRRLHVESRELVVGIDRLGEAQPVTCTCSMPSDIVTRTKRHAQWLTDTVVVTVEQLIGTRGDVVASTVIGKALR